MADLINIFDDFELSSTCEWMDGHIPPRPVKPTIANGKLVKITSLETGESIIGSEVEGQILSSGFIGYRDGDHFRGQVTGEISEELMVATNWQGQSYFGKAKPYDVGRFTMGIAPCILLRNDEFCLIKITQRRSAKGTTWQEILPSAVQRQMTEARVAKATVTRKARRAQQLQGGAYGT